MADSRPILIRIGRAIEAAIDRYVLGGTFVIAGIVLVLPLALWLLTGEVGSYDKVWPVVARCALVFGVAFVVTVTLGILLDRAEKK